MAYREKIAWVTLGVELLIWGGYFWRVAFAPPLSTGEQIAAFVSAVIATVVLQVILTIVVASLKPSEAEQPADERERLIGLKANSTALAVLTATTLVTAGASVAGHDAFIVSNLAVGGLILSEVVRLARQILGYRLAS